VFSLTFSYIQNKLGNGQPGEMDTIQQPLSIRSILLTERGGRATGLQLPHHLSALVKKKKKGVVCVEKASQRH